MMLAHVLYLPQLVRILSCILLGRASDRQMLMRYSLKLHASKTCLRHTQNLVCWLTLSDRMVKPILERAAVMRALPEG